MSFRFSYAPEGHRKEREESEESSAEEPGIYVEDLAPEEFRNDVDFREELGNVEKPTTEQKENLRNALLQAARRNKVFDKELQPLRSSFFDINTLTNYKDPTVQRAECIELRALLDPKIMWVEHYMPRQNSRLLIARLQEHGARFEKGWAIPSHGPNSIKLFFIIDVDLYLHLGVTCIDTSASDLFPLQPSNAPREINIYAKELHTRHEKLLTLEEDENPLVEHAEIDKEDLDRTEYELNILKNPAQIPDFDCFIFTYRLLAN